MYGITFNSENNILNLDKHDCGILSNASVIFKGLLQIHETISNPIKIYWSSKSIWNKPDRLERNVYELYFKTIDHNKNLLKPSAYFNCMIGNCTDFNFKDLLDIRNTYFNLSNEIKEKEQFFINKYKIDFDKTISILYRGTDKIVEVPKIHPKYYLKCIDSIKENSNYKILLQTDQQQILEYFKNEVGNKLINIEEMPLTKTDKVMHFLSNETHLSTYELGISYIAVVSILSKCKYVIFDTNNAGLWICIFRGNIDNTCQINANICITNRIE